MNQFIIYHRSDLDGFCSGAIAKLANPDAQMIGMEYGDEIPWNLLAGAKVIMVDFSLQPWSEMQRLGKEADHITWIDHHKTAITEHSRHPDTFPAKSRIILDPKKAACELSWETFFPSTSMPRYVWLLGRYDVWDLEADPDVLPFQMGIRGIPDPGVDMWPWTLLLQESAPESIEKGVRHTVGKGKLILQYQKECNAKLMGKAFVHSWCGLRFLVVNAYGVNSLSFEGEYDPVLHDAVMAFYFSGTQWTFSMYSPDQSQDLSDIAGRMGGGGHAYACGFQVKDHHEVLGKPVKAVEQPDPLCAAV